MVLWPYIDLSIGDCHGSDGLSDGVHEGGSMVVGEA